MKRRSCERCSAKLYYHERRERWCCRCAKALDVLRLADAPRYCTDEVVTNRIRGMALAGYLIHSSDPRA